MDGQLTRAAHGLRRRSAASGSTAGGTGPTPTGGWTQTYELIHELQPAALVGTNHHRRPFPGEDFQMFEKDLPGGQHRRLQQGRRDRRSCRWRPARPSTTPGASTSPTSGYKSTRELIHYLVAAAGHDANFLLNVGPMPNGKIQPEFVERLQGDGQLAGRERRVDLRHARRPGHAAPLGRDHPEGRHRLRPRAGLGRRRPRRCPRCPPREVGAPARRTAAPRRAADARPALTLQVPAAGRDPYDTVVVAGAGGKVRLSAAAGLARPARDGPRRRALRRQAKARTSRT